MIIRRTGAVGDSLAASVVADKLAERGYAVTYQTHPNNFCLLRRQLSVAKLEQPGGMVNVDLDGAYEKDPKRRERHFSEMFMERANEWLRPRGLDLGLARNCKPKIVVQPDERAAFAALLEKYPKPWVFICPKSNSYRVRQVPNHIWADAAPRIRGTCFWLGTTPAPPPIVDLSCRHLDNVIGWLSVADLLVSVDTGPLHIAAALGVPIVAIGQSSSPELHLSDQCDFVTVSPGKLDCLNCQLNICPKAEYEPPCQFIDPDYLATWVNARIGSITGDAVSAVISIYRPDAATLNHCLANILPQVGEVIIVNDDAGAVPGGVISDKKIRFIRKRGYDLGYARKLNYGVRHSSGKLILALNDDLYASADMVEKLRAAMLPGVALTAPLLRFKNGKIQHAGMVRDGNGGIGFGHIDYDKFEPTFRELREVECVTGAAVLFKRRVFFDLDGYDELFYLYAEDTDFCMKVRKAGHKIMYAPEATGIHDEHLSTGKTPNILAHMQRSNAIFGQRWKHYFERNRGISGLGKFS